MLKRAKEYAILENKFRMKVLIPEDIIGLKVQATANDPKRSSRDIADIEELLRINNGHLDMNLLREYFSLFGQEHVLNELLGKIENA